MERLEAVFGARARWQRPGPTARQRRHDLGCALAFLVVGSFAVEVLRSLDALDSGRWLDHLAVVTGAVLLVWRRSHPLWVAVAAVAHLLVVGLVEPGVVGSLPMQVLYFLALYSGVAWAAHRRAVAYVALGIVVVTFAYLAWLLALGSGIEELVGTAGREGRPGSLPPAVAGVSWVLLTNALFFGGAFGLGQVAWSGALQRARGDEQAATIADQSRLLRDQAVVDERLRIARELHDVVAHHVSVAGVQATAARRVLDRDPAAAREALDVVAESSREAIAQMRDLLGTLRTGGPADAEGSSAPSRSPEPTLVDLPRLARQASTPTCRVTYDLVEDRAGAAGDVPAPVQVSAYRIVQEAVANVHRHSTAREARAVVRVARRSVEVEVVDDGLPRPGTSGTGLGHLGMRERAAHLGGEVEVGPRATTGFRVRVVLPRDGRVRVAP